MIRPKYLLIGIFLGTAAIFIWQFKLYYPQTFVQILKSYHLLPEPEPLTELYFENHTNLPSKLIPGKSENFRFTIHNLEYQPINYTYLVSFENATDSGKIATGEVSLTHDTYKTITQDFSLKEATRTAVIVSLKNRSEKIQVWLDPFN